MITRIVKPSTTEVSIVERIRKDAVSFRDLSDLDHVIQAVGDARIVLLGEATHGTSEFYSIRAELSKRLIAEKGFQFIAVEGDWPSCYEVNRYIKNLDGNTAETAADALQAFNRWPSWMWANKGIETFAEWLRHYNAEQAEGGKIGFYGLDMYSLWDSIQQVIGYLQRTGSPVLDTALQAFSCLEPYGDDAQSYGISAGLLGEGCEEEVIHLLNELNASKHEHLQDEGELDAKVNAMVTLHAEQYYRTMVRGGPESWNIRDYHMADALRQVLDYHGSASKAIIWEHNTHIGDARATDMQQAGMINIGQLVREQYGRGNVFSIGFGTHHGTVIAGSAWGAPAEVMRVPEARTHSWEDMMFQAGQGSDQILMMNPERQAEFNQTLGHRAIGVVYDPRHESGNYVPSQMAERYDAFIYVHETHALEPLSVEGT
ncbi:protein-L-isoaspartate O-methyltransferase [Paenibacillus sp. CAA11]|uniref:erythromycin esterase family protein n=1 Tax=Paenibacillus sp. CAA11 TaxID=1532905 RepID=UPI000D34CA59|nr:erythromycin esterase family protein [Paenibacillus sp. CAA11]AWB46170.1 protein-L-isoaspartate O-methyltransferase [Paenibacillus sp. CAA11]